MVLGVIAFDSMLEAGELGLDSKRLKRPGAPVLEFGSILEGDESGKKQE